MAAVPSAAATAGQEPPRPGEAGAAGQEPPKSTAAAAALPKAPAAAAPASDPDGAKKRTVKGAPTDSRKPVKPRPRRASKPETKEQPWNADSPFLPVPTSKP